MISLVMCSRSDTQAQEAVNAYRAALRGVEHEVIPIIGATSMCAGYNEGVRRARGEIVIFSHDDVEPIGNDFAARLLAHMERFDVIGVAGTTKLLGPAWSAAGPPHVYGQVLAGVRATGEMAVSLWMVPSRAVGGIEALDGLLIAARRAVLDAIPFDESIPGFHLYDLDFSYCASRAGFKVGVACDLDVLHWGGIGSYGTPQWTAAAVAFMEKHGATLAAPATLPEWKMMWVRVSSREEALAVMHPPYFEP